MKTAACLVLTCLTLACLMLAGCSTMSEPALPPLPPAPAIVSAPATAGAIYREGSGLALFQDVKAHQPGDVLTIVLSESTQAKSSASTSSSKDDSAALSVPTLFGAPFSVHGREVLGTTATAKRKFDGSGDTAQSNQLTGDLTVTVVQRLANGNLVVQGEKQLRLNQADEIVRIQGTVRPEDIAADNTVPSSRVADARIVYTGRGALAGANKQGWLSRFFSSGWMPF